MSPFDLLLVALVLAGVTSLFLAAMSALRGQRARAARILRRIVAVAFSYAVVVVTVSALVPRQVLRIGEPLCFDDWCITVEGMRREDAPGRATLVDLRIASRARRVIQREVGVRLSLSDSSGRSFEPVPDESDLPLDIPLAPGQSVAVTRRFALPPAAQVTGLVVAHGGFPIHWFILGEGPFRKRPIVLLESPPD